MKLRQTLEHAVNGYWDGGPKQVFDWSIDRTFDDGKSRVGSWSANHYFEVRTGVSERDTLSHAKQHLQASTRIPSTFQYVDDDGNPLEEG